MLVGVRTLRRGDERPAGDRRITLSGIYVAGGDAPDRGCTRGIFPKELQRRGDHADGAAGPPDRCGCCISRGDRLASHRLHCCAKRSDALRQRRIRGQNGTSIRAREVNRAVITGCGVSIGIHRLQRNGERRPRRR